MAPSAENPESSACASPARTSAASAHAVAPGPDVPVARDGPCTAAPRQGRRLLFGAACSSFQPLVLSALMLPATAYVIRVLGPTAYGEWAIATSLVGILMFMTNLGLRGTFVRAVAKDPAIAAAGLSEQLGVRLVLSVLAGGIGVLACFLLGYSGTVLLCGTLAAVALVLATIATTAADLLQAFHRLPAVAAVNMIAGLFLTAASVAAAFLGGGPVGVAASYCFGPAVSAVLLLAIVQRQHFPVRLRWDFRRFGRLLWEARYIAAHQLMDSASGKAEGVIVPRLAGPTMFGFFSAGTLLATRGMTVPEGLCSAAYPSLVDAYRRGPRPFVRTFLKFLALMIGACVPAALVVSFLAGPVARLLFPGRAEICEQVMRITIWLLPVMGLEYIVGTALSALHKDALQARAAVFAAVCNILMTVALVWSFGIVGASWSMVLRYVVKLAVLSPTLVQTARQLAAEAGAGAPVAAAAPPGVALP